MNWSWASSGVDLGYTVLFCIPEMTAVFLSFCDCGLGESLVFHQHIEGPYMFDWEHGIALHPMQGIRSLAPAVGDVSWDLSSCSRNVGYILALQRDGRSKLHLVQRSQDSCLVRTKTSGS